MWNSRAYFSSAASQADDCRVPVHITVDKGYVEPPHLLPDGGTDGTAQYDEGRNPSPVAAAEGDAELAYQLPERQAVETTQVDDESVRTPIQVVPALLPSPRINATEADYRRTSIQAAVSEGYVEPGSLLPAPGAVMTAQVSHELTPSKVAAAEGHMATIHIDDGKTPLTMAPQQEHQDVARVLPDHGTEARVHDDQQWCHCIVQ